MDDGLSSDPGARPPSRAPSRRAAEIDPLLGSTRDGSGAVHRPARVRRPVPDDTASTGPLSIIDDPSLDVLDRGPVVMPVIVPAEPVVGDQRPPTRPVRHARRPIARSVPLERPRVRRVTRVVRHLDVWSVFKVAGVFNCFLYVTLLTSGVLLWQVAQSTGTIDNVERFFENFGWTRFELKGGEIYHNAWIAGLFVIVGLTGLAVLAATLFNLITDLVGGVRLSVLEEEVEADGGPVAG